MRGAANRRINGTPQQNNTSYHDDSCYILLSSYVIQLSLLQLKVLLLVFIWYLFYGT